MTDKTILEEVHGTIIDIYDYTILDEKSNISTGKNIIIQPDDSTKPTISEAIDGHDYSKFSVGQRVVHVLYTWKRPATKRDNAHYAHYGKTCPSEIDAFGVETYDEVEYGKDIQSGKTR